MLTAEQLNEISAVTASAFDQLVVDQFQKSSALASILTKKPHLTYYDGGKNIQIPVEIAESKGRFTDGEYDVLNVSPKQNTSFAIFDWKFYDYDSSMTEKELAQNQGSKQAVIDLYKHKIDRASVSAARGIAKALHGSGSDDNGRAVNGLKDIFAPSGISYGGLTNTDLEDPSTWLTDIDTSTNTINYANITNLVSRLKSISGGDNTSLDGTSMGKVLISNYYVRSRFAASQQVQQFLVNNKGDLGFSGIVFDGVTWYIDSDAPGSMDGVTADNYLYVLSPETFTLAYRYGFEGKKSPFDRDYTLESQSVRVHRRKMVLNLTCNARRYNGVFKNLLS